MSDTIDTVDYAILKCLDGNGGCWKKQVHKWITEHSDEIPVTSERSVQTIGRRIDTLHESGKVESCILSDDSANRGMNIGYTLTEEGYKILAQKRKSLLREQVVNSVETLLTEKNSDLDIDRNVLIAIMSDEFDIDDRTRETVLSKLETRELVALLAAHYFLTHLGSTINPGHKKEIAAFMKRTPQFAEPFIRENMISRLRSTLTADRPEQSAEQVLPPE